MQTAVGSAPDIGVPGDLADLLTAQDGDVDVASNEEASASLPFGLMVKRGTADRSAKKITGLSEVLYGVAVRAHEFAQTNELDSNGVRPKCQLGVLVKGRVVVAPEDAVTKASGVYVRCVDGDSGAAGSFRGTPALNPIVYADKVFTAEADDDTATAAAHGLETGDGPFRVSNAGGGLPTGLAAATDYWIIKLTINTFKFATSFANAIAGTAINLTTDGTGTQTLSDKAQTFTGEADDDTLTANGHGLETGDQVTVANSGGALPTGLAAATTYYVIKVSANAFKLATTYANAVAGTALDLTTDGSGTNTVTGGTKRIVGRNLSKFAKWIKSASAGQPTRLWLDMTNAELAGA